MAVGQGKYDDLCTMVREQTGGHGAAIIVVEGNKGHGFSVQMTAEAMTMLPNTLEYMASQMRKDLGILHINDSARWAFSMRAMENPGGPEDAMGDQVGEEMREKHEADEKAGVSFRTMAEEVIDEAIKRLAGVK